MQLIRVTERLRTDDVLELGEVALEGQQVGELGVARVGLCGGAIMSSRLNGYTRMEKSLSSMYAA